MLFPGFRKANNRAIAGFLLPFLAAGFAAFFVLSWEDHLFTRSFLIPFVTIIPVTLGLGLFLSITSIPLIEQRGDKDYAYSGLILNLFFILLYLVSVILYFIATYGHGSAP